MTAPFSKSPRILLIDDNAAIHSDFRKILSPKATTVVMNELEDSIFATESSPKASISFEVDSAFQGRDGLKQVEVAIGEGRPYALAFVDVRMPPGWDGIETIEHLWKAAPDLQVVICTAYSDYSWDDMFQRFGKSDRLVILKKPFDNVEVLQLAHTLTEKHALTLQVKAQMENLDQQVSQRTVELRAANAVLKDEIAERSRIQDALRLSDERFSQAFKSSPIPQAIVSERHELYLDCNDSFLQLTGFAREALLCRPFFENPIWKLPETQAQLQRLLHETRAARDWECQILTQRGERRNVLLFGQSMLLGAEPCLLLMVQDVSERQTLEGQLRQAQKMEAVGQLAAGVAHDFNNLLTVIQGHAQLILSRSKPEGPTKVSLDHITGASQRASLLTRQLLTFSRQQPIQLRSLDLSQVLHEATAMLSRMLGENIAVKVNCAEALPPIQGDSGMLDQIIVNLAVNARDAMPQGGKLIFTTRPVQLDEAYTRCQLQARAGAFVCLEVADTGCGMDAATVEKIFEPFFTTKPTGKGTGLGLATVYAIAKQHQGWVEVASQVGVGTTFKVFLPASAQPLPPETSQPTTISRRGGEGIVLVVEDEAPLREFISCVLRDFGYKVLEAENGKQALTLWRDCQEKIDLLLTDLVMPEGVSGWQLAEQLQAANPALKVIYTSGYSPDMFEHSQLLCENQNFLPKPFQLRTLTKTVGECMGA